MIPDIPTDKIKLTKFILDLVETCRASIGLRSAYYRMLHGIAETGRYDGTKSLVNMMYAHLTRTAAMLFSPVELEFKCAFARPVPPDVQKKGHAFAHQVTELWDNNNIDMEFGRGVFEALKYGACFLKQWPQMEGEIGKEYPTYHSKLVMPWQFGVYREDENKLENQEVLCETSTLSMPEVWYRIHKFSDAETLFKRIKTHARKGNSDYEPSSFFHQVLSTNQLNTTGQAGLVRPGGIVNLQNDPVTAIMGPVLNVDVVQMHEIWVKADENRYVTLQLIEPDILISKFKHDNLLISSETGNGNIHPYTLIQPNEVSSWIWGRSELVDIVEPQQLLSTWMDDAKRLLGLQIDRFLAIIGEAGLSDEVYGQARLAGYMNISSPTTKIEDLTPDMPEQLLPMIKFIIETINTLGGFPPILQGQGEAGVRAGVHAETLVKTGSPTLRDRALLVERQCASAADKTGTIMEAKEEQFYWSDGDTVDQINKTLFLISQLPPWWKIQVDSHKSSPIFANESGQLIFAGAKLGWVDGEYGLDNMPFPNKEMAQQRLRAKEKQQAALMQELLKRDPEALEKIMAKKGGHH
jgi:hypothetical protein